MDGRAGSWEPEPNAHLSWLARKSIEKDLCGPREPENPLVRLIHEAAGRTEGQEVALSSPENILRAQADARRRLIERRLREAQGIPVLTAFLSRALAKLPRPAIAHASRGKPVYVAAHWQTDAA